MEIRLMKPDEIDEVIKLVVDTFMKCDGSMYGLRGIYTFEQLVVGNTEFREKCIIGDTPVYVAIDDNKIVGVLGLNEDGTHINMFFVDKEHHRMGIGKALFERVLDETGDKELTIKSLYSTVQVFEKLGFVQSGEPNNNDKISYVPMVYKRD